MQDCLAMYMLVYGASGRLAVKSTTMHMYRPADANACIYIHTHIYIYTYI